MEFRFKRKSHAFQIGKELEKTFHKQIIEGKDKFSSLSATTVTFSISKLKFVKNIHKFGNQERAPGSDMSKEETRNPTGHPFEPKNRIPVPKARSVPPNQNAEQDFRADAVKAFNSGTLNCTRNQTQKNSFQTTTSASRSRSQISGPSGSSFSLPGASTASGPSPIRRRTERIKSIKRPTRFALQPTSTFYVAQLPSSSPSPRAKQPRDRHNSLTFTTSSPVGESRRESRDPRKQNQVERTGGMRNRRSASVDDLLGIRTGDEEEELDQASNYQSESRESHLGIEQEELAPTTPRSGTNTLMSFSDSDDEQDPSPGERQDQQQVFTRIITGSAENLSESWRTFYETIVPEFDPILTTNNNNDDDDDLTNEFSMLRTESLSSMLEKPMINLDTSAGDLKLHDKIVWFTETGTPEVGTVKWIGNKFDRSGRWFAGVEFKNPVGNCSGKWNGKQYFTTRLTHGRFVPISELILYLDFYGSAISNAPAKINYPPWEAKGSNKGSSQFNPIICVICQDPLIETESVETEPVTVQVGQEMVTTFCGHLFHWDCLTKWFNTKKKIEQPCPYCQKVMDVSKIIRIFPVQSKN